MPKQLALLALVLAPAAEAQLATSELLLRADDPGPVSAAITSQTVVHAGVDEGWVASRASFPPGGGEPIVGELLDDDPAGIRILRTAGNVAGVQQFGLHGARVAAGRIAYMSGIAGTQDEAAWLDDTLLVRGGEPFAGDTLAALVSVLPDVNGRALVYGVTASGGTAVVEYPGGTVRLMSGQPVAGTSETVGGIIGVGTSASGAHVIAKVTLAPSGDRAVVLNGALLQFAGAAVARQGTDATDAVDAAVLQGNGSVTFSDFSGSALRVTDDGVPIVSASIQAGSDPVRLFILRDGRIAVESIESFAGVDANGGILTGTFSERFAFEGRDIGFTSLGVDGNDDGSAEAGIQVSTFGLGGPTISGSGRVYARHLGLTGATDPQVPIVIRSTLKREQVRVCPGLPNATGRPARLNAVGTRWTSFNQMELVGSDLPLQSFAMPVVSLTPSAPTPIANSVGRLCLGGALGRVLSATGPVGRGGIYAQTLPLDALPQGAGTVAAQPGQTWFAQLWYRDVDQGVPTSNFSDAIAIELR